MPSDFSEAHVTQRQIPGRTWAFPGVPRARRGRGRGTPAAGRPPGPRSARAGPGGGRAATPVDAGTEARPRLPAVPKGPPTPSRDTSGLTNSPRLSRLSANVTSFGPDSPPATGLVSVPCLSCRATSRELMVTQNTRGVTKWHIPIRFPSPFGHLFR